MKKHFWKDGELLTPDQMLSLIEKLDPINDPLFSKQDDTSLSRLFSEILKDYARYNTTSKEWFV